MKYAYALEYINNKDYANAIDKIAASIGYMSNNIIVISSMKNMSFDEVIELSEASKETQILAFAPIFTDPIHFLRTLDMLFAVESKTAVMRALTDDMYKGQLLTREEFLSALDAIEELSETRSIIDIVEDCDAICKMLRKFELGHVELFATATFDGNQAMMVEAGIRCLDPVEVFFNNLSKIPNQHQHLLISAIVEQMRKDKQLTSEEASAMDFSFLTLTAPPKEALDKFSSLLRNDYVFLYDDEGTIKIGFQKVETDA